MTICTVENEKDSPIIKLMGKELEKAGFKIGDKYEVIIKNNMIVLIKITDQEIKELKEICLNL